MIVIIDYGIGNTASIRNMIRHVGGDAIVSGALDDIRSASGLILPGIGAFDHAMSRLNGPLSEAIRAYAASGRPLFGICLGMQLLFDRSEEGELPGLGLIPGDVRKFDLSGRADASRLRIPHMGWNVVAPTRRDSLYRGEESEWRFYFVHSYHTVCRDEADILATTDYGGTFTCSVQRGNIYGAQFHPEKSHRFGKQVFTNFVGLTC